jgi:23S rRNA pseudouridine1911/1915/1917 synthase
MDTRIEFETDPSEAGKRLDQVLAARIAEMSRTRLKALIEAGHVTLSGEVEESASTKLTAGDLVALDIPPPEAAEPAPEAIPLSILYEDRDVIVIDKPPGLVVHPAPGHWTGTLVNALLHHCGAELSGINGVKRPGIVHRLDKDTSGVMVVAKSDAAHRDLAAQFADHGRNRAFERVYTAFVWGALGQEHVTYESDIGRDPRHRQRMAVRPDGTAKPAITHVVREGVYLPGTRAAVSCLACALETGRTHQIRVHLAHGGHPILGDDVYGSGFLTKAALLPDGARDALESLGRQALHAVHLAFEHPITGREMAFDSGLPSDLVALEAALKAS